MRLILTLSLSLFFISALQVRAQAECLATNNETTRMGNGVYSNGKLSVSFPRWHVDPPRNFDARGKSIREIEEEASSVPAGYEVTIRSNAPGFNTEAEGLLDHQFDVSDTRLCPGRRISMDCAVEARGNSIPRAPFICKFSEGPQ